MASHSDIANRWADVHAGTASRYLTGRGNVFVSNGRLFSYGSHFELARLVKPKKGAPFYLLNGDIYSVTTSRHQSDTRAAVARHADKFLSIIVPHTALASAGIDLDSIVPVHVEHERTEKTSHRVTVPGLVKLGEKAASGGFGWDGSHGVVDIARDLPTGDGTRYSVRVVKRAWDYSAIPQGFADYDPPRVSYYRDGGALRHVEGDTFEYDTYRHFLGASVFSALVTDYSYRPCRDHADNGKGYCDACGWNIAGHGIGRYSNRPPMIERKRTRRAYFVSTFDSNESRPHYFLAELPATLETGTGDKVPNRPKTVSEALDSLAPWSVRVALHSGADVKRQGDVFAIPNGATPSAYPIPFKFPETAASIPLDGTGRHVVSELVKLTSPDGRTVRYFGRGIIRHGEHKRVKLETWHELVRNRVPMSAPNVSTGTGRFGRYAPGIAAPRAWSIIGRID